MPEISPPLLKLKRSRNKSETQQKMAEPDRDEFLVDTFPEGFMWCTATASYQIEGGYDEDGKGRSIWDTYSHTPGKVMNGDTGDVACDSYHRYTEDVELLKKLGVSHYRFSIAWTRILPDGTTSKINEAGIAYYTKLIDALIEAGIKPVVTLFHWDLPQSLQDIGGWLNSDIADYFADYARVCYENFGDKVKWWITLNEPTVYAWHGYGDGHHAPGLKDDFSRIFKVGHNLLIGHGKAFRVYDQEFRAKQGGKIGITLNSDWNEPKDPNSPEDIWAAEFLMQLKLGIFANPIFGSGEYPEEVKELVAQLGEAAKLPESPLRTLTDQEKVIVKGSSDFMGVNNYTSRIVSKKAPEPLLSSDNYGGHKDPDNQINDAIGIETEVDPSWKRGASPWLYQVPWGLRRLLQWIKTRYDDPVVFITENGFSDSTGQVNDDDRIEYLKLYINEVLKAVKLDGCNIVGYTVWSLLDNFEWSKGYTERFGIHFVDFDDEERKRTPKKSAQFYKNLISINGFKNK